ncbi:unnamed protein product [Dicrocoelium dendriticum]|nr:unnamed protein product [Dicrocoelium dendriticum]
MDREKVTKAASQCGFIRFVILPLFEAFAKLFPPLKEAIVQPAHEQLSYYTELSQQELSRTAGEADESADESQD